MSNEEIIKKELNYFNDHYMEIFDKHKQEWIAIKDGVVICHGKDKNNVLERTLKKYELGTFLFKQVLPKEQYEQRFFSRVF